MTIIDAKKIMNEAEQKGLCGFSQVNPNLTKKEVWNILSKIVFSHIDDSEFLDWKISDHITKEFLEENELDLPQKVDLIYEH